MWYFLGNRHHENDMTQYVHVHTYIHIHCNVHIKFYTHWLYNSETESGSFIVHTKHDIQCAGSHTVMCVQQTEWQRWIGCKDTQILTSPNLYIVCLQKRNVCYVRAFFSFDWSVSIGPGGTGSRKSQMSMLSSNEPLTIWKSSNCRPYTAPECSCDKRKRSHQSWPGHTN